MTRPDGVRPGNQPPIYGGATSAGSAAADDFAHSEEAAARRTSFGAWARDYDRYRPGYSREVLDFLLAQVPAPRRIVDLGAGTGQLTCGLLDLGADVYGVEPDPRMRSVLAEKLGPDRALAGTAEQIPFPDNSIDGVFGSQMWHWVDPAVALAQIARVLRPGGVLAIIWNLRDDREDWISAMNEHVPLADAYTWFINEDRPDFGADFEPTAAHEFEFSHQVTADQLVGLVGTISLVALGADAEQRQQAVRELTETHPSLAGRTSFPMPYVAKVFTARRR